MVEPVLNIDDVLLLSLNLFANEYNLCKEGREMTMRSLLMALFGGYDDKGCGLCKSRIDSVILVS